MFITCFAVNLLLASYLMKSFMNSLVFLFTNGRSFSQGRGGDCLNDILLKSGSFVCPGQFSSVGLPSDLITNAS